METGKWQMIGLLKILPHLSLYAKPYYASNKDAKVKESNINIRFVKTDTRFIFAVDIFR